MGIDMVYAAYCDSCEEDFEEGLDMHWPSRVDLEAKLKRAHWVFLEGALYCPNCNAEEQVDYYEDDDEEGMDQEDIEHRTDSGLREGPPKT
jgi:hypothetical protein